MKQNMPSCTLPPLSKLLNPVITRSPTLARPHLSKRKSSHVSSVLDITNLLSPQPQPVKAKRKRASPSQLTVLNRVFSETYFPSTELRVELGKQLGMSPRTVQIWFQNKRQSIRARDRTHPSSPVSTSPTSSYAAPSPPLSPQHTHSLSIKNHISLPPLRLPCRPSSPPRCAFPSPTSIDAILFRDE